MRFGVDGDGNYGYYGADDSLIPFSKTKVITKNLSLYGDASEEENYSGTINLSNDGITKVNYACILDISGASGTIRVFPYSGGNKTVDFVFDETTLQLSYRLRLATMYSSGTFAITILIVGE